LGEDDDYYYRRYLVMMLLTVTIALVSCILFVVHVRQQVEAEKHQDICNVTMKEKPTIEGIYYPEGYYCVWVAGRNLKEINDTDTHERCHALIDADKDHFCKY